MSNSIIETCFIEFDSDSQQGERERESVTIEKTKS
jgi:hypothetical protein